MKHLSGFGGGVFYYSYYFFYSDTSCFVLHLSTFLIFLSTAQYAAGIRYKNLMEI